MSRVGETPTAGESFLRAPLAAPAAAFIAGIACERWLVFDGLVYPVAAGLLLAAWMLLRCRGRWLGLRLVMLCLLAFVLGGWRIALDRHALPPGHVVEQLRDPDGRIIAVRGRVQTRPLLVGRSITDFPEAIPRDPNSSFLVAVEAIRPLQGRWQPAGGTVRVNCAGPALGYQPGDWFERTGRLLPIRANSNPGGADLRQMSIDRRVFATFHLPSERDETPPPEPPAHGGGASIPDRIRTWARGLLLGRADPLTLEDQVLLDDLVLGRRGKDEELVAGPFLRTGTYHYLAISGLHLGILAGVSFVFLRVVRVPSRWSAGIVLAVVAGYCLMAEPRPPILRAGLMVGLVCLAMLLYRQAASVNLLALAAIVLLAFSPGELFGAGFQLSFLVVLGLLLLAGPFYRRLYRMIAGCEPGVDSPRPRWLAEHPVGDWTVRAVLQVIAVSIVAWVVGLPVTACCFGRFYPWSVLSSVAMWLPIWITLVLGFAKMAVGLVLPGVAEWFNSPLHSSSAMVLAVVAWLDRIPLMSITVGRPGPISIAAFYSYLALWWRRPRWLKVRWLFAIGLAGAAVIALATPRRQERMELAVLDVGNGLCQVVGAPGGQTVIFDCGSRSEDDLAEQTVMPFLESRHEWHEPISVRAAIISHAHMDHYNGVPGLARRGVVRDVFVGPAMADPDRAATGDRSRAQVARLGRLLRERGAETHVVSAGRRFQFGQVEAQLLWPPTWVDELDQALANETSLVVRLTYAGRRILLTGDISDFAVGRLLDGAAAGELDLGADVLVMPHHDAVTTLTDEFIRAVNPSVVIISSRRPAREIIARSVELSRPGRAVFATRDCGAVTVSITPGGQLNASAHIAPAK